ncbi:CCA-adding enzyme isoform X2 [Tripterygium wilfordii]|uniref:CCA-adding enzyme isoform X2 n=1 Tax=Tripterygium wilfordii TaxID=458696 RepID=UPI0018F85ED1|nr:CCA-adding enzyme isoform X2 [Tripterygium wilfordii]
MALRACEYAWKGGLIFHRPLILCFDKVRRYSSVSAVSLPDVEGKKSNDESKAPQWKKLDSDELGIRNSMISEPTRVVLKKLKKNGYEVYLVGGCVRDLILNRTPKDFDIVTSAELKEIRTTFHQCEIVGKRFPICHVHVNDSLVEVSSFSTSAGKGGKKLSENFIKPKGCNGRDYIRWRNCIRRDFTINGLMFDPYAKIVYDYMGGMEDIRKTKVRTVMPANTSFLEDCARILRAIRIAARLGFSFSRELALSLKQLSRSVLRLDKGRILMEMNYMLAYGSAEASLRLLWRFGLLEILLPIQASYFVSQGFRRRDNGSNMLLSLFSNLDKLVAPDRPCHNSLWICILAFHKALVDRPRDPLVIAAFALAVHNGGSLVNAVEISRRISRPHDASFHELQEASDSNSNQALIDQIVDLALSIKYSLRKMMERDYVSQAMAKYPRAPCSDLVFISEALSMRACKIFECVRRGKEKGYVPRRRNKINYKSLAEGSLPEVRRLFARIVSDTVYPPIHGDQNSLVNMNSHS